MGTRDRHLVLWDGECGMCRRFAESVQAADTAGRLELVPYQDCPSPPMTDELRAACERALHVITTDGELLRGADAVLFVYGRIGWRGADWLRTRPLVWLLEPPYRVVAANRRWSSKFFYTGDQGMNATCKVQYPPPEEEA